MASNRAAAAAAAAASRPRSKSLESAPMATAADSNAW